MPKDVKDDFDRKYEILKSRDKQTKTEFYYGVKTTNIFCLPGCSSRLANPENVVFFNTPEEAVQRGFRPCKRCNPLKTADDLHETLITSICRIIEESENPPGLKVLAAKTGYSESYIQRFFKKSMGITPREYGQNIKTKRFREELSRGSSVTSSIYSAGFGSSSRVYENIDRLLAMSPSQFKNKGKGLVLRMNVFQCYLGSLLIAFTDKGVSSIEIGTKKEVLINNFENQFQNADIRELTDEDRARVDHILKKIENPGLQIEIPLDIHGTVFQQKVWKALRSIPSGKTASYSEIAVKIGSPASVRAVANACGKNNLAILIPCHRVIRKNGDPGGYKWGLEMKSRILQRERETGSFIIKVAP